MKRMMVLLASVLVLTACTQPKKIQGGNRKKNGVNHKSNLVC